MSDFTQANLDEINEAIASGALRVEYSNPRRTIEYRSIRELKAARDMIREDLGKDSASDRIMFAEFHEGT